MSGGIFSQDDSAGINPASISIGGSALGTELTRLLMSDQIQPGSDLGYQTAKIIYEYHPMGARLADEPIILAQSQPRTITVNDSPEQLVKEKFESTWTELGLDSVAFGVVSTGRIYGIGSMIYGGIKSNGTVIPPNKLIDVWELQNLKLYFSVMDPLNTSGSLVLNQDPNAPDFQKAGNIAVAGTAYHQSRSVTFMNERPIYLSYQNSTFGFSGRSVYQRALYPLKSFIRSMITDDMVCTKAGLLVTKVKQPGSIIDNVMAFATGVKRKLLKEAQTGNVLSIDIDESAETLNMMNLDGAFGMARKDILENIAASAAMPAVLLTGDAFALGFGEGTEDAKKVAHYINRLRMQMQPIYAFLDRICMHVAWSEDFYKTIQAKFPDEYGDMDYKAAFYRWKASFKAEWPSLLIEPESERAKSEDVKLKSLIAMLEVLLPEMDPENKAKLIQDTLDNFNDLKLLFTTPLILDFDTLEDFLSQQAEMAQKTAAAGLQAGAEGSGDQPEAEPPPESGRT